MFSDPRARLALASLLLLIFLALLSPAFMSAYIVWSTEFFHSAGPQTVDWLMDRFKYFHGLPADTAALLTQATPAFLGAICYRQAKSRELNTLGLITFFLLLVGAGVSATIIWVIEPTNDQQSLNFVHGSEGLNLLEKSCESTLRTAFTYLLLILGLQIKISNQE